MARHQVAISTSTEKETLIEDKDSNNDDDEDEMDVLCNNLISVDVERYLVPPSIHDMG
jgi:hypothetical protein